MIGKKIYENGIPCLTFQGGYGIILEQFAERFKTAADMRGWRNWQTRTFEVRVGNLGGSNPLPRTTENGLAAEMQQGRFFFVP